MNKKRPINLDLGTLTFPPMAIVSILHRISGVALFLLMPVMLYLLTLSLHSAESFAYTRTLLSSPIYKLILWGFGAALIYHVFAGIRHMVMDLGLGESLEAGRRSAILVIVLAVIATLFLGIKIW